MKEEKKDKVFLVVNTIIFYTALIGAILTLIFGYHPQDEIIDNIFFYGLGTVVFTFAYYVGFYLLVSIIIFLIFLIIDLFSKNK